MSPPENFFEIFDAKSRVWGQFGPQNKLIKGQPNEYDVICRNASVLAFHLWPTIFAGEPSEIFTGTAFPHERLPAPLPLPLAPRDRLGRTSPLCLIGRKTASPVNQSPCKAHLSHSCDTLTYHTCTHDLVD